MIRICVFVSPKSFLTDNPEIERDTINGAFVDFALVFVDFALVFVNLNDALGFFVSSSIGRQFRLWYCVDSLVFRGRR